jgi:methyl-accepting chemotaxis protein PixJ
MFNKTDETKNVDTQNGVSPNSSQKHTNTIPKLPDPLVSQSTKNSRANRAVATFRRLSLRTKATVIAVAIGTLPVLGIGTLAYLVASQSITNKISQIQQSEAKGLADKVNRFMIERYRDVQRLSTVPFLTNPRVQRLSTTEERQSALDKFLDNKVYESIAVLDLNGDVIVQTRGGKLPNQSKTDYFQKIRQNNSLYITQPEISASNTNPQIIIAAPIKDDTTGEAVGVLRASIPIKNLEDLVKNYAEDGREYFLTNARGKFFLASEQNLLGKDVTIDFPGLKQARAGKEGTIVTFHESDNETHLLSYASTTLPGLPDLKWQVLLSTDTATAFEAQRNLLLTIALGTGLSALIVAYIAAWIAKRATQPIINATAAVAKLGEGKLNTRVFVESEDEIGVLSANINQMAAQLQTVLREKELDAQRARQLADITLLIRKILKIDEVYNTAVQEIRQALKTDRVVIYEFNSNTWDGAVIAESVTAGLPRMLGTHIDDPCFRERHVETYKDGRVRAISNIYQDPNLNNAQCYIKMLEKFAVKANLIAPIITDQQLIGLMIAHHCDTPRNWEQPEIDLFQQLAIQVGYAVEQAKLLEEVEKARAVAEESSDSEREQKEALQMQLLELLSEVEGAASGDLTVRAEVTAGEIGTVADFFNSIVESLRAIVTSVQEAATQVNNAVGSNEEAIHQLAQEALTQAAEINRTLDAVDDMTQSIQAVAHSAEQAATVANTAANTAKKSGMAMDMTVQNILHLRETVGETAKKVKRLGESTQQISRVVALINQISMQTNLLAINAGIEAARAGEEGQGFAVVAEEVGELAARSASATTEIEQIVENIQRETTEVVAAMELGTTQVVEGTRIVEDAKHSLSQILEVSRQIDYLVQSIKEATASQVNTSHTVRALMQDIASVSQRTSDSSLKVSESLQQTVAISQQLQAIVGTFKVS